MSTFAWDTLETPIGQLLVVCTDHGLRRVGLPVEPAERVLAQLRRQTGAASRHAPAAVAPARQELAEYFAGERREFTGPLDLPATDSFRLRAWEEMFRIPYGTTITYGELAARAGNPTAARAAGQACATNPLPVVLPCHRVVRFDGGLNWYTGGLHFKEFLLRHEGAIL